MSTLSILKQSRIIHLCCGIIFFTAGLIVNFLQFVCYISIRPFSKYLFRKINWYFNAALFGLLVFLADWWSTVDLHVYMDNEEYYKYLGKEHAYCIMNHTYEIDWLLGWVMADKVRLLGNCKAYIKKELQYMPVLGWAWKLSEFIVLERSFEKDKEVIETQVSMLGDYPDPMWILMFPEGTRFTETKHKASEEFARDKNLAPLKYHLQPRTRGFVASLPAMQGKVPAVYDITVAFAEKDSVKPSVFNFLLGKPIKAYMHFVRIPMENVPTDSAGQEKFLYGLFQGKDKLRESFLKHGDFFTTSGFKRVEVIKPKRRLYILFMFIAWSTLILIPMLYYLIALLFSGNAFSFSIGAGIILLVIGLSYKLMSMSKISSGSKYGTTSPKKTQ